MRIAVPFAIAGAVGLAAFNLIILVLGLTHSSSVVGAYEPVATTVGRAMALIPLSFAVAFIPAATTLFAQGHKTAYETLYMSVSKLMFVATFPAVILLRRRPLRDLPFLLRIDFLFRLESFGSSWQRER